MYVLRARPAAGKGAGVSDVVERAALLVVCRAAEVAVRRHRLRYDASARVGVPAHVTVGYPFVPLADLGPDGLEQVSSVMAGAAPFDVTCSRTGWFGEDVLYLAPDDPDPLVALTEAVTAAFPDHPPYGGRYDVVTPHVTVAHDQPLGVLHGVEQAVLPVLPVGQHVTAVELWAGPPPVDGRGRWRRVETFALGGRPALQA